MTSAQYYNRPYLDKTPNIVTIDVCGSYLWREHPPDCEQVRRVLAGVVPSTWHLTQYGVNFSCTVKEDELKAVFLDLLALFGGRADWIFQTEWSPSTSAIPTGARFDGNNGRYTFRCRGNKIKHWDCSSPSNTGLTIHQEHIVRCVSILRKSVLLPQKSLISAAARVVASYFPTEEAVRQTALPDEVREEIVENMHEQ